MTATTMEKTLIDHAGLDRLIGLLKSDGFEVLGPTLRDRAIVYDEIDSVRDLPAGWTDEQDGGTYRIKERSDKALFGYANSPQSWKRYLHPPLLTLFRSQPDGKSFQIAPPAPRKKFAFIGVRSCELHAIAIQDRVFLGGPHVDTEYKSRREQAFIVAVNCGTAGGTCFCVSMKTGPKATFGYDLSITELIDDAGHRFLVEVGSEKGAALLLQLPTREASTGDTQAAEAVVANTAQHMGRQLEPAGVKELLRRNLEHPRWDEVADRCLNCGNCTQVCPTCFCTTVEDVTTLDASMTERVRRWDSCFTLDHSYIHGGSVRGSGKARYRQWLTHKLSTWWDQFGTSGCVGCGRCITWCPVAIDITEEVSAIRATDGAKAAPTQEK